MDVLPLELHVTNNMLELLVVADTSGSCLDVPADQGGRRAWLRATWAPQFGAIAQRYRSLLVDLYGAERGERVQHAEAFEVCEYGAPLTPGLRRRLFPFIPE